MNYRCLNGVTVNDRYPLTRTEELRNRLGKPKWFTKFNLKNGFHLLWLRQGYESKTAFPTHYELYEDVIMPFALCNALSTFQTMINSVLDDLLNEVVIAYIHDILIYSESEAEYTELVKKLLQRLREAKIHVNLKKSVFLRMKWNISATKSFPMGFPYSKTK